MVIDEINNNSFSGYFRWRGVMKPQKGKDKKYNGTEKFKGTYNPKTQKVSIQGYEITGKDLGLGKYEASLTENNKDFTSGTSSDGGTWEAKW
jgi:hypothetical protein